MILDHPKISYSLIQQAVESIFIVDRGSCVIFQNNEARKVFGFTDEEILGASIHQKLHRYYADGSEVPADQCKVYRAARFGETTRDFTWLISRQDGSRFYASCSASPLVIDGEHIGAIFFATDVTAHKQIEDELRSVADQLQMATAVAGVGLYDYYPQTGELRWSDTQRKQFGVLPDAPITLETYYAGIHPDDRERVRATLDKLLESGHEAALELEFRTIGVSDGKERCLISRGRVFVDEQGKATRLLGANHDITERKQFEESLRQASQHCPLTGLPNRSLLQEYTDHLFAMAERDQAECAVLFIDLDRFKPINDLYGHDAGDKVLQEVARRLRYCTRKEDIISRLGGDEFVVVLPHINTAFDPQTVAQHVISAIEKPISFGGEQMAQISASLGVSLFPKHGKTLEALIKCADVAMYSAKRSGRNTFRMYIPGDEERSTAQLQLEIHVRHALEAGSMTLLYQPIVDLHTGTLTGVEALVRMVGDNGDLVEPTQFIPVAEDAGLIDRVGHWVAHKACQQHQAWREAGLPPLSIAINVSPVELRQRHLAQSLSNAIETSGMDPKCLEIEITESAVMGNVAEAIDILNEIRALGVGIALDDFGTGYSSLSCLSALPLDKLKIDQSFVSRLGSNHSSQTVTDSIISLGRAMNLQVVGEGIESPQALEYLKEHGCSQAQGYLYSKPLPPDEFEAWYRSRTMRLH